VEIAAALAITLEVVQALEALGIPYLLGGSLAASFSGIPRATRDADLVVDLDSRQVHSLAVTLRDRFYLAEERMLDAIRHRSSFNLIHLATGFKVDVFVPGDEGFAHSEMVRRQRITLPTKEGNVTFQVASPEDLVIQKLRWFQLGGGVSEQQWTDLLGVLKVQRGKLDFDYLAHWSAQLGVADLLRQAINETSLP
jgi:hypothetical protein